MELPIDDSWMRDSGPIFVTNGAARWRWCSSASTPGAKYRHDKDARVPAGRRIHGVRRYVAPMVLEGGSFFVDGEERSSRPSSAC
jgi:agmatine deiminase